MHKSEPEPGNGNVNTVYFIFRRGEILESVAQSLFTMNEHAIANVYLYLGTVSMVDFDRRRPTTTTIFELPA